MGLPITKNAHVVERIEAVRRESEGNVDSSKVDVEGHARDVVGIKVTKKEKSWISRITGVAHEVRERLYRFFFSLK